MDFLIDPLLEIDEYNKVLSSINNYSIPVGITGPSDSQKAHIAYALCEHSGNKGIFIAYNEMQARRLYDDFAFFLEDRVLFFPAKEVIMHDVEAKSNDSVFQRTSALERMLEGSYNMLVTSAEAFSQVIVSREYFEKCILEFESGTIVDLEQISRRLLEMGYDRVVIVENKGQFTVRGGIIDIFSVSCDYPVRIELFDDEVDSIRKFDTISQRSVEKLEKVKIIPARDIIYPQAKQDLIISRIQNDLDRHIKNICANVSKKDIKNLREKIEADMARIKSEYYFPGIDRYIPYIEDNPTDLTDYTGKDTLIFVDEPVRFRQRIENIMLENYGACKELIEKAKILPKSQEIHFSFQTLDKKLEKRKNILLSTLTPGSGYIGNIKNFSITTKLTGSYQRRMDLLAEDVIHWKNKNYRVVVLSGNRVRGEKLVEALSNKGVEAVFYKNHARRLKPGQVIVLDGSLNKGFEYPSIGLAVVSEKEIFGPERRVKKTGGRLKGSKISVFTDLNVGDYVVHQAHGIGQYVGVESLVVDTVKKDYLKIRYLGGDFLYIPTNQLDLIQKYIGSEDREPKLNKLGGTDWARTKRKVKESLKEIAAKLIELYAQRQALKGHAFSEDTVWQKQFEELFHYEETEDQLRCIEEVKRDMESSRPMDRLLCGDVGFGKTEVAIRAVFKAIMDGKQAAYLVPTTILAQQHYNNFKERMKDFPVTVDVISRFRTAGEQRKILKNIRNGSIDVLIGTHRLLQKDIHFKDLGLLIIDEEQRFGVTHKERLKNIKPNVDVLTLTATPIPRTLHMSLVGIRDISIIEDPPEERYPVQTYVMEYNADVVKNAIIRELGRQGQVFYLFNRVRSIDLKASEIQAMIPEGRVAVAHGQMDERQLENIMLGFINGEYDILVCTTIIESGLDMPNVNTIIVEDADRMGLSQLYQLRGRVGRSNRLAYAYITYRKDKVISELAQKRLQAIKEFTELGSGFKVAMRDLEIRGAGNLLGPEQHGHMEAVGYDMYCRLLDQAVRELRGEPPEKEDSVISIDINISAYIDDNYISSEGQKIEMYKKIASINNGQDVVEIEDELVDRFGEPPQPVKNLISIAYIKVLAKEAGFSSITQKNDSIIFQVEEKRQIDLKVISRLTAKYRRKLLFNAGNKPYLLYKISGIQNEKLLDNIKIVLQDIKSFEV
jgi:transcription-repair coupling factor (superfamily II helicase)